MHRFSISGSSRLVPLLVLLAVANLDARPKKDIIRFRNGDKWTCEIKKLDHGFLSVGLDYVDGTVQVDWSEVVSIESPQQFVVLDQNGKVFVGGLSTRAGRPDQEPALIIRSGPSEATIPETDISSIEQTELKFWNGLHGGVSGGVNFTKGESQTQFNFNSNVDYRRKYWSSGADFQSSFAGSVSVKNNLRNELSLYTLRLLNERNYFGIGIADFLHSDEQQLALRTVAGGGVGKILVNTDRSQILVLGGAVWTNERYTTDDEGAPRFNSAEGLVGARLQYFRFTKQNYFLNFYAYPSFTEPGRIRADANAGIKFKLIKDLTFNLNVYLNYDSHPPRSTSKSDYGANSTIGWTF
jgi:hypothetical protein